MEIYFHFALLISSLFHGTVIKMSRLHLQSLLVLALAQGWFEAVVAVRKVHVQTPSPGTSPTGLPLPLLAEAPPAQPVLNWVGAEVRAGGLPCLELSLVTVTLPEDKIPVLGLMRAVWAAARTCSPPQVSHVIPSITVSLSKSLSVLDPTCLAFSTCCFLAPHTACWAPRPTLSSNPCLTRVSISMGALA